MKKHKKKLKKARKIMLSKLERKMNVEIWQSSVWLNSKRQKALKEKRCKEKTSA